jgi:hypothetical protein
MKRAMTCALAAVVLLPAVAVAQGASPGPSAEATPAVTTVPSAVPESAQAPRIHWASGGIELTADDLRLRVGDRVLRAPREVLAMGQSDNDRAELEAWWFEKASEQRLNVNLDADEIHWWIDSVWAYDGHGRPAEWVYFDDLAKRTRTPLGESLVGDLRIRSTDADREEFKRPGSAVLRLEGLRLSAFTPGMRPAALTGCDYVVDDRISVLKRGGGHWRVGYPDGILQGPGEPLEGWQAMTPKEIEAELQEAGLCYRFIHTWRPTRIFQDRRLDRELEIRGESRCSAPETGEVTGVEFRTDVPSIGPGIIVYVRVHETQRRDWPEPPPYGTDCSSR